MEGGMVFINNSEWVEKMCMLCSYGIINDLEKMIEDSYGFWYY